VEVIRIYNTFAQTDMSVELRNTAARIEKLIERIAREKWSARRIEQYATKLGAGASEEEAEGASSAQRPASARQARSVRTASPAAPPSAPNAPAAEAGEFAEPPPRILTRVDGRVVIEARRIQRGVLTPEEREELIAVLEELLMSVRRT
jgi:hypothetical protein